LEQSSLFQYKDLPLLDLGGFYLNQRLQLHRANPLRIPAIVTGHSKFIVTDKLLMLEG
jgi:hypothetical protein